MSGPRALAIAWAALLLGGSACGTSPVRRPASASPGDGGAGVDGEEASRAALRSLPSADRIAFYQLATVDGLILSRTLFAGAGRTLRVSFSGVADARRRLGALHPRDQILRALRAHLADTLARVGSHRPGAARAVLTQADAVSIGLLRYQAQHPGVVGLVPG